MPNDFLEYDAHAYNTQPVIQTGYMYNNGGVGAVNAIVTLHPMLIAHANNSTQNLIG
jgi:hypothetical protein